MNAAPSLLLVEYNEGHNDLIQEKFRDAFPDAEISRAKNLSEALKLLPKKSWDMVITNWLLPDGSGADILDHLASHQPFVAVAILADDASEVELDATGHHGAVEILTKDRQTLESFVLRVQRLMSASQRINRLLHEKAEAGNGSLFRDPLTQVYNRAYFEDALRRDVSRANRYQHEMSLLIADVDGFPNLAKSGGRGFVERCLKDLAAVLVQAVRSGDIVARYGENQFAMLLTHCKQSDAVRCARRVIKAVENRAERFTVSIGVMHYKGLSKVVRPKHMLQLAERALHQAKAQGGSCYQLAV
jgi:two-component system cell cycle response regulator